MNILLRNFECLFLPGLLVSGLYLLELPVLSIVNGIDRSYVSLDIESSASINDKSLFLNDTV